jgi:hypothetical protein
MPAISPAELRHILDKLGITLAELADLLDVHPVSARRWGSKGVPDGPAGILIRLLADSAVSIKTLERSRQGRR